MVAPVRRGRRRRARSAQRRHLDRLVAGRAAAGQALEQADLIGTERHVEVGRGRDQPARRSRAPAGTPSARASVRCGRNGLSSMAQPASRSARVDRRRQRRRAPADPPGTPSHSARGRPADGNAPAPPIEMSNGSTRPRPRARTASAAASDPLLERRPEEAEGQVEAVEADPADVTAAARDAVGPDPLDERGDLATRPRTGSGTATNRRRPGRSAPGQRGRRPAVGHPRSFVAVSRSQTSRSVAQDLERATRGRASRGRRRSCPRAPCRSGRSARSRRGDAAGPGPGARCAAGGHRRWRRTGP